MLNFVEDGVISLSLHKGTSDNEQGSRFKLDIRKSLSAVRRIKSVVSEQIAEGGSEIFAYRFL